MREIKFRAWDSKENKFWDNTYFCALNGTFEELQKIYIIEQYTGLRDKNGREIYEGDIIEEWGNVEYIDAAFFVAGEPMHSIKPWRIEVIGNIHETPELLEATE